tara:strand:- start:48 stop:278 length:231 start_codon:yes stop_codon:yes gene_type:complete
MARKKNYGPVPAILAGTAGVWLVGMLALAIPIFLFGIGAVIKAFQVMFFSPIASGSIPIWSLFVVGILVIMYIRRR